MTTCVALRDVRVALLLSVFLLPFSGLDVDVGLRITMYQVALLPVVLISVARLTQPGFTPPAIAAGALFAAFLLWSMIWSLLQLGVIPQPQVGDSILRSPSVRAVIQIMLLVFALSPIFVSPMVIDRMDDVRRMGRLYIAGVVVLAIIGWAQLAIWYATGTNPIPVEAFNALLGGSNSAEVSGSFGFESLNIYRMNSFAGEPRELAIAACLAILMLQAHALTARNPGGWRLALIWLLLFVTLLATFSTSGLGLWLIASLTLIPACLLFRIPLARSPAQLLGAAAAFIVPTVMVIAAIQSSGFDIIGLLSERTIERLGGDGAIEDFDLAILSFLASHPRAAIAGTGLGNAHLYATPYLDPLFALYAEGNVFIAKTLYLRLISEVGVIGFFLFLGWYFWLAVQARLAVSANGAIGAMIPIAGAVLVVNLGSVLATSMTFAAAAAMTTICAIGYRQAAPFSASPLPA
jgi:hypothetical protein